MSLTLMKNIYIESITDTKGIAQSLLDATKQRVNAIAPSDRDDPADMFRTHIADSSLCVIVVGDDWNRSKFWITTVLPTLKQRSIPAIAVNPTGEAGSEVYKNVYGDYARMFRDYDVPVIEGDIKYLAGYLAGANRTFEYEAPGDIIIQPDFQISIASLSETISLALERDPNAIHKLTPRQFEEFIAELMEKNGYDVTLTQATRDNGVDIYAVKTDGFGKFLTVVDCKKYREDRKIGIGVVREMIGTLQIENASHAMLATTSSFSSVARNFEQERQFAISLRDHSDILQWSEAAKRT